MQLCYNCIVRLSIPNLHLIMCTYYPMVLLYYLVGCTFLFILLKKHLNAVFHSILFSVFHSYAFFHSYTFFIRILFICTFCFIGILFIRILFFIRLLLICILFIRILFIWVLLKPPTTDPPTTDPLTHGPTDHLPFTYRPTDHLPTDPPTDYNQNSLNRRPDSKHVLHFLILENS